MIMVEGKYKNSCGYISDNKIFKGELVQTDIEGLLKIIDPLDGEVLYLNPEDISFMKRKEVTK